ncbi:putative efflux protein, MATE family [Lachnospiraceae bacterium C7]|nr:putative efflux protein, MATE family [Lachnospiraceae bacterium C7]
MSQVESKNYLFEKEKVSKAYLKLAIPLVIGMVVSLVYNMVDTYFIALTNNTNLVAGVSISAPVFTLMIAFGDIWGLGGSSVISRLFGEKKYERAKKISAFCYWAAIIFAVFITTIFLILKAPILNMLGATKETYKYASDYYTWIVIGAMPIILTFVPNNVVRTEGFAVASMLGSIIGSIVNIVLDPILIFSLGLGASGAAIATVCGNICGNLFYAFFIIKKSKRLSISPRDMQISMNDFKGIISIGIPAAITNVMQSLMVVITNRYLLKYSSTEIAAMGIAMKVNMITSLILIGFAFGGQPLVGYNYGARNKERLKKVLKFAFGFEMAMGLVFSLGLSVVAPSAIKFFMNKPEIISTGTLMLRCLQAGMVFMAIVMVATCSFQSAGQAISALILSAGRQGFIYFIVIFVMNYLVGYMGILFSQAISDFVSAIIAVILMKRLFDKME